MSSTAVDLPAGGGPVTVTLHAGHELSGQIVDAVGRSTGSQQLLASGDPGTFSVRVASDGQFDAWLPAGHYSLSFQGSQGGPSSFNAPQFLDYRDAQHAWSNSIGTIDDVDLASGDLRHQTITLPEVSTQSIWPNDSDGNRLWGYQAHVSFSLSCRIPSVGSTFGTPAPGPVVDYTAYSNNTLVFYACADDVPSPEIHATATPVLGLAQQYQPTSASYPAAFAGNRVADLSLTPQPPHRVFSYCSDRLSGGRLVSTTSGEGFDPASTGSGCTVFSVPADTYQLVLGGTTSSNLDLTQGDISNLSFPRPVASVEVAATDTNGAPASGVSLTLANYVCSGSLPTSIGNFPFSYRLDSLSSSTNSDGLGVFSLPVCETAGNTTLTVSPPTSSNLGGETLSYVLPFTDGQIVPVALSSFEGTFTDAVGSILPDQTLSIVSESGEVVSSDSSGSDGGVSLAADPGVYTFDATGSIGDPVTYSVAIPKVDLTHHHKVDLALPTRLIPISVVDDSGKPVPNAVITLASSPTSFAFLGGTATGTEYGIEKTDAAGKAVLEVLPSDALSVSVTGPSGSTKQPVQRLLSSASTGLVTVTLHEMAPAITSAASSTFVVGVAKSFSITTSGSPAPSLTESGTLPAGLSFHDNGNGTATISGTPTSPGTVTLTLTAANGVGTNATQTLVLTITQAPTITSAASSTFVVGVAKTFLITTSGSPAPSLTESGTLPAGLSFHDNGNGTATISGTPTSPGTATLTLTAANGVGTNATQTLVLTITAPTSLTITTSSLLSGKLYSKTNKVQYSSTLTAVAGNAPYKWTLVAGSALPPGLKLSKTGVISGKATAAGTFLFTVQVTDTKTKTKPPVQQVATRLFFITIN